MTQFIFSKVPGFGTWTGDKRVHANQTRTKFVAFVINLETLKGSGVSSSNLAEVKQAVEYFNQHFTWPDGSTP